MRHRSIIRGFLVAGALGAVLAPAAPAQDLRSPDARDEAPVVRPVADLRSPDALAGGEPARPLLAVDLRSADARVAGEPAAGTVGAYIPSPSESPAPAAAIDDGGFDLGAAAIGAAGALVLALVAAGMLWALGRRRTTAAPIGG